MDKIFHIWSFESVGSLKSYVFDSLCEFWYVHFHYIFGNRIEFLFCKFLRRNRFHGWFLQIDMMRKCIIRDKYLFPKKGLSTQFWKKVWRASMRRFLRETALLPLLRKQLFKKIGSQNNRRSVDLQTFHKKGGGHRRSRKALLPTSRSFVSLPSCLFTQRIEMYSQSQYLCRAVHICGLSLSSSGEDLSALHSGSE